MIETGDIIETNYNTGPYQVRNIIRGCTCPSYLDTINTKYPDEPPRSAPHIHLECTAPSGIKAYWLNGYDEETLKSVWQDASIKVIGKAVIQLEIFEHTWNY